MDIKNNNILIGKDPKLGYEIFKITKVIKGIIHFGVKLPDSLQTKDVYVNDAKIIYDTKKINTKGYFGLLVSKES